MRKIVFTLSVLMIGYTSIFAVGALFARRPLTNDPGTPLWLKSYDATVSIIDQIAVTHVDHVFKNESSSRLEGIFVFPLPEGSIVTELALWINGTRVTGDVMERDTARAVYESIVRRSIDPALLEYMGDNIFRLSVFPIEPNGNAMSERRIEITYAELLPFADERVAYTFFMKTVNLSSKPVERASIAGALTSQKTIVSLSSPTHAAGTQLSITRRDDRNCDFVYGDEKAHSGTDLVVSYRFEEDAFALNNLVYIPDSEEPMFFDAVGDDGYFLLWVTPPQNPASTTMLPRNIALMADISSSMSGTRIVQLRSSLNTMVDMLTERDRFSILAFSSGVQAFRTDMVAATAGNKAAAHAYINGLSEAGLTNYEDALRSALKCTWSDSSANVAVFFTDGKPTWPVETSAARILTLVKDLNTDGVSIYSFGVGDDLDEKFLRSLAVQNSGAYYAITSDGAIASILSGFMKRISYPLLKGISLDYGTIGEYDVYPRTLPNLFAGTQLSVLGRFRVKGVSEVTFSGQQAAEKVVLAQTVPFDEEQKDHPFVPRMWASSKIDYLLGEIAVAGEQQELVDNVKMLGKKYSIITPYTSMLVLEPDRRGTSSIEDKCAPAPSTFSFT
ncbi:MAG: VWA domain-containing protein, partial [Chitinispirillaceae bacterium]|nr:VWA domain-containing protein [Chitinispirillaceae bacterium]